MTKLDQAGTKPAMVIRLKETVGLMLRTLLINIATNKVNGYFVKIDGESEGV